jgi:hypothetical protein
MPLFTVLMTPQRKSGDAGSASKPTRIRDVVSFSENLKILDMIEIEKKILFCDCQVVCQTRIFGA